VRTAIVALCLAALLTHGVDRAPAAPVSLEVANLTQSSFEYYIRGPVGWGEGELTMPTLDRALAGAKVVVGWAPRGSPTDEVISGAGAQAIRP